MRYQFPFFIIIIFKKRLSVAIRQLQQLFSTNLCPKTINSWYFSIKTCRKKTKTFGSFKFSVYLCNQKQSREIILSRIIRKEREAILQITKEKESSRYETVKIYSSRSINELHHYPLLLLQGRTAQCRMRHRAGIHTCRQQDFIELIVY